jgi:hypothetical protein
MPPKPLLIALAAVIIAVIFTIIPINQQFSLRGGESEAINAFMPAIISLILFVGALWVIVSRRYTPTDRHWAYGAVGTIVGFWLHLGH